MPEIHLQPGFTHSTCGTFSKNKERIQKIKERKYSGYVDQNEPDKACIQHDMSFGVFKESFCQEEQLLIKCYIIKTLILLKIPNIMDIDMDLPQWFINFLIKNILVIILQRVLLKVKLCQTKD